MGDSLFVQKHCAKCGFLPFCMTGENGCGKQVTSFVRTRRHLKRNEILCSPKNKFQNLYAIEAGALKSYQIEMHGKELIHGFYFAGEIVGYKAICRNHYLSTIVALTDTVVCEIPYENFLKVLDTTTELQKYMLHLLSRQLNTGSYLAGSTTAEQRIAAFLLDVMTRMHVSQAQSALVLPMTRQDIGCYLGLTAETVSRTFSRFQMEKLIAIDNKQIHILQVDALKNRL